MQQNTALYEKVFQQVASMQEVFKQVFQQNNESSSTNSSVYVEADTPRGGDVPSNISSGDGPWQDTQQQQANGGNNYPGAPGGAPSPGAGSGQQRRSQLQIWRETKMEQAVQQYIHSSHQNSGGVSNNPAASPACHISPHLFPHYQVELLSSYAAVANGGNSSVPPPPPSAMHQTPAVPAAGGAAVGMQCKERPPQCFFPNSIRDNAN